MHSSVVIIVLCVFVLLWLCSMFCNHKNSKLHREQYSQSTPAAKKDLAKYGSENQTPLHGYEQANIKKKPLHEGYIYTIVQPDHRTNKHNSSTERNDNKTTSPNKTHVAVGNVRKMNTTKNTENITLEQAVELCDKNKECIKFSCDTSTNPDTELAYTKPRCMNASFFKKGTNHMSVHQPREVFTKTSNTGSVSPNHLNKCQMEMAQMLSKDSMYSFMNGTAQPHKHAASQSIHKDISQTRVCQSMTDTNCFLEQGKDEAELARKYFRKYKKGHHNNLIDDPQKKYTFYKDDSHHIYAQNTNNCCFETPQQAQQQFINKYNCDLKDHDKGKDPECENLFQNKPLYTASPLSKEHSVFEYNVCPKRGKKHRDVYRKDLNICF